MIDLGFQFSNYAFPRFRNIPLTITSCFPSFQQLFQKMWKTEETEWNSLLENLKTLSESGKKT